MMPQGQYEAYDQTKDPSSLEEIGAAIVSSWGWMVGWETSGAQWGSTPMYSVQVVLALKLDA